MIINSSYITSKISPKKEMREDEFLERYKSDNLPKNSLLEAFSDLRLKLGEHMKLDTVSFVLGNGASMYAGSRNTMDFKLSEIIDVEKYKDLHKDLSKIDALGMEEQLNALITIKAYYHIIKSEKEVLADSLIDELKKHLIESYVNSIDYRNLTYHEMLLLKLRAFGCIQKTKIYTPNYDLAFEYTLDQLSIEYADGFSGFVNRRFDPRSLEKKQTSLVKIHGSVNWVYDGDEIKEIQPHFQKGKAILDFSKPVLIYPTSNKLYQTYTTPYSELMRRMLDSFESGKNVILILGYKYGDDHINEILLKALVNPNNIFYFFDYDDGDSEFIKKVKQVSTEMPNVNVFSGKILGDYTIFVRYMLPATPEKTDQEIAITMLRKVLNNA